jgi:hypothetical protein
MLKKTMTAITLTTLLAVQSTPTSAGAPDFKDLNKALGEVIVGTLCVGAAGSLIIAKSIDWAQKPDEPKKTIGRGILVTSSVAVVIGLGYLVSLVK